MSELDDLIKKKKEIEKKIQVKKIEKKHNKKNNSKSKANALIRVSKEFNYCLEEIIDGRVKIRKYLRAISKPKLTNLIMKHKNWGEIKNDCINFNFEEE